MMKIVGDRLSRYLKIIEPCEILVRYLLIFNSKLSSLYPFAKQSKIPARFVYFEKILASHNYLISQPLKVGGARYFYETFLFFTAKF